MFGLSDRSSACLSLPFVSVTPISSTAADKRASGIYYTRHNCFEHQAFHAWARRADLPNVPVVEPFAGAGALETFLRASGWHLNLTKFDIEPQAPDIIRRNTLTDFPQGFRVAITNPPWLARNSATRRAIAWQVRTAHTDLYLHALGLCLAHCDFVAALVPESFLRARLHAARLTDFVSLAGEAVFTDTDAPVGLALFAPYSTGATLWSAGEASFTGTLPELLDLAPQANPEVARITFNAPDGELGLIAIDNTRGPSIRFCDPAELGEREVSTKNRSITRIKVRSRLGAVIPASIDALNERLTAWRQITNDTLLAPFHGTRKDGRYRRRLDYRQARGLICETLAPRKETERLFSP